MKYDYKEGPSLEQVILKQMDDSVMNVSVKALMKSMTHKNAKNF